MHAAETHCRTINTLDPAEEPFMTRTPGQSGAGAHPAIATVQPLDASAELSLAPAAAAAAAVVDPETAVDPAPAADIAFKLETATELSSGDIPVANAVSR
jgi:hypothetical protein